MRKLGTEKTVRIFVPVPEQLRDDFRKVAGGRSMAEAIRNMMIEKIATAPKRKSRPAEQKETA